MPFYRCGGGNNLKYIECVIGASPGSTSSKVKASISLPSKLVTRV